MRCGQAEWGTSQPLTPQPAQPEVAWGQGEALLTPGKAGGTRAQGSGGTQARGTQPQGGWLGPRF